MKRLLKTRPYFDDSVTGTAKKLGLSTEPKKLEHLAPQSSAGPAAALVRESLDDDLFRKIISF